MVFDAPSHGQAFIDDQIRVAQELDAHKNRYRSGNKRLPPSASDELLGFDWPPALARALGDLPAAVFQRLMWVHSQGHSAPIPAIAETFDAGESPRWGELSAQFAPWTPTPMLQKLAERISRWLN